MNSHLHEYVQSRSSAAFRRVVEEHINAIHSQCLRQLRDAAMADDVTQTVFATLAQKAAKIPPTTILEGWLFNATRYCCANALRAAGRRRAAELKAATMRNEAISTEPSNDAGSSQAEDMLDDALAHLGARDREAVLLRFFAGRSMREVGDALGVSEDAAKQRVFRTVERLRAYFNARGVAAPAATVVAWLGIAVKPAGTHLVDAAVRMAALKCAAGGSVVTANLFSRLAWIWPKAAVGFIAAGALTAAVVVSRSGAASPNPSPQGTPAAATAAPILADASAPEPATQPADQLTPLDALNKLSAGIQADDRTAISECLCDDGADPVAAGLARAFLDEEASVYRLEGDWQSKFGAPMAVPGLGFDDFGSFGSFETLLGRSLAVPNGPEVKIDGDMAQVCVPLPPEAFTGKGQNRVAAFERWSGAMLVLKHGDDKWKLDTDRTVTFVGGVSRESGNDLDTLAILAKVDQGISDGLDTVSDDIESGKISTRQRAVTAVLAAASRAFRNARVQGANQFILPVIGGSR